MAGVITCEGLHTGELYEHQFPPLFSPKEDEKSDENSPLLPMSVPPGGILWPLKVWDDLEYPSGVAIDSVGDIIFSEYNEGIFKFDTNGQRSVIVGHSECPLTKLESLAIDGDDNVYCTDKDTNKVLKCDKDGANVVVKEVKQMKGPGHYGVAVVGEEVMVCECNNEGIVMVYDRELNFIRSIQHSSKGECIDVTSDNHGNLYVTNGTLSCVQVFNNNGTFLRCFSEGSHSLKEPHSLCASGQYVYVTDWDRHCVSVFTTDGDYVTSFGQHGCREGELSVPSGMCTDKDGVLYVADFGNRRIQSFR